MCAKSIKINVLCTLFKNLLNKLRATYFSDNIYMPNHSKKVSAKEIIKEKAQFLEELQY